MLWDVPRLLKGFAPRALLSADRNLKSDLDYGTYLVSVIVRFHGSRVPTVSREHVLLCWSMRGSQVKSSGILGSGPNSAMSLGMLVTS